MSAAKPVNTSSQHIADAHAASAPWTLHKILLVCGIVAAALYIGGDIVAALRYEGYSYTAHSVSELSAIGAPTRPFLLPLLLVYSLLETAFAAGVWMSAGSRRGLRMTAGLLFAHGILNVALNAVNLITPFAAMHTREEIAAGSTTNDTLHLVYAGVTVLLILLMIGFGASAFGKRWRIYSYATIAALLIFGAWAAADAPRVAANLPTPWLGLRERVNVYGFIVWLLMLAILCLRALKSAVSLTPAFSAHFTKLPPAAPSH